MYIVQPTSPPHLCFQTKTCLIPVPLLLQPDVITTFDMSNLAFLIQLEISEVYGNRLQRFRKAKKRLRIRKSEFEASNQFLLTKRKLPPSNDILYFYWRPTPHLTPAPSTLHCKNCNSKFCINNLISNLIVHCSPFIYSYSWIYMRRPSWARYLDMGNQLNYRGIKLYFFWINSQ